MKVLHTERLNFDPNVPIQNNRKNTSKGTEVYMKCTRYMLI